MIRGWLSEYAAATGGRVVGEDAPFSGLSTDSRSLAEGELFVALRGERFDAHRFLDRAVAGGAAALVVEAADPALAVAQLEVTDTLAALGAIARQWRERVDPLVVGITGSNGKTTVKNLVAAILGVRRPLLATQGNFNNDVGVPLTLSRLGELHDVAVVEMGCNRPGDIARLAALAQPDVAVVTNAAAAHLELLGSVEGVAREKGALFAALADDGAAAVNADDAHADYWRRLIGARRTLTFGVGARADVRVSNWRAMASGEGTGAAVSTFRLSGVVGPVDVHSPLAGEHNALNAAAAAAAALLAGASAADVVQGISRVAPAPGRLAHSHPAPGVLLIDDTYNANPASLQAAVAYLTGLPGRAWLVLGDMAELGGDARTVHAACGRAAMQAGVEALYTLGDASAAAAAAAGPAGHAFQDVPALVNALVDRLESGTNLLVKGSRSAAMERVVAGVRTGLARGDACSSS